MLRVIVRQPAELSADVREKRSALLGVTACRVSLLLVRLAESSQGDGWFSKGSRALDALIGRHHQVCRGKQYGVIFATEKFSQ